MLFQSQVQIVACVAAMAWHGIDVRVYCRPAKKAVPKKEDKEAFLARTQVNTGLRITGKWVAMIPCSFSKVGRIAPMKTPVMNRCGIPTANTAEECRYHGQTSMLQPRARRMFRQSADVVACGQANRNARQQTKQEEVSSMRISAFFRR